MNSPNASQPPDEALYELYCGDLKSQLKIINDILIASEKNSFSASDISALLRAIHSIKGASKVINLDDMVHLTHSMEDALSTVQTLAEKPSEEKMGLLFKACDFLQEVSLLSRQDLLPYMTRKKDEIVNLCHALQASPNIAKQEPQPTLSIPQDTLETKNDFLFEDHEKKPQAIKLNPENLNQLMSFAAELLVELPRLDSLKSYFLKEKASLIKLEKHLDKLRENLLKEEVSRGLQTAICDFGREFLNFSREFENGTSYYDNFSYVLAHLSEQLYLTISANRLRPFSDAVESFPRMIRDLSHQLGKSVNLDIQGLDVLVDREVLERLISPLTQLLKNAIDHGIETPQERSSVQKKTTGLIVLSAFHRNGRLWVTLSDDGRGADLKKIKKTALEKRLVTEKEAANLSDNQWLPFLFLPRFFSESHVSEISGRGVGLSSVNNSISELGGSVVASIDPKSGTGMLFTLSLPLSLSVIRVLLVKIAKELYALPLAGIHKVCSLSLNECHSMNNALFFENCSLIDGDEIFSKIVKTPQTQEKNLLSVVFFDQNNDVVGLIVEEIIEVRDIAVLDLSHYCGKIPNIAAGTVIEDMTPVLVIDQESLSSLMQGKHHDGVNKKWILVVDDSHQVRSVLKEQFEKRGACVKTAIHGRDAWNALCEHVFDLIVTDIAMPQLDGIELLTLIKKNQRYKDIPAIVISAYDEKKTESLEKGAVAFFSKNALTQSTFDEVVSHFLDKGQMDG